MKFIGEIIVENVNLFFGGDEEEKHTQYRVEVWWCLAMHTSQCFPLCNILSAKFIFHMLEMFHNVIFFLLFFTFCDDYCT